MKNKTSHKIRMSQADAHYGGNLVEGARVLALFGDAATELCIRESSDEGLFRAYESIEFLAPVYAGDFLEIHAEIIQKGKSSRKMKFEAYKIIEASQDPKNPNKAQVLKQALLVVKAVGTCVVKK